MKFKIIEQKDPTYEEFKQHYLNPKYTNTETMKHFQMGYNKYKSWSKMVQEETGLIKLQKNKQVQILPINTKAQWDKTIHKYYYFHKTRGKWRVQRKINNKITHFGYYDSEEICKKIVNKLHQYNWDKTKMNLIEQEVL